MRSPDYWTQDPVLLLTKPFVITFEGTVNPAYKLSLSSSHNYN